MNYAFLLDGSYMIGFCVSNDEIIGSVSKERFDEVKKKYSEKPAPVAGCRYRLRADTLEWELAELPPSPESEYEPTIEDKAEAYDILMGEDGDVE